MAISWAVLAGIASPALSQDQQTADDPLAQLRTRYTWGGIYLTPHDLTYLHNAAQRALAPGQQDLLRFSSPGAVRVRSLLGEFGSSFRTQISCVFFDLVNLRVGYLNNKGSMGTLATVSWTPSEVREAAAWVSSFLQERQLVERQLDVATSLSEVVDIWTAQARLSSNVLYTEDDRAAVATIISANLSIDESQAEKLRRSNAKVHKDIVSFQAAYAGVGDGLREGVLAVAPAGESYLARSQVSSGLQVASPALQILGKFFLKNKRWPASVEEAGLRDVSNMPAAYLEGLTVSPSGTVTLIYNEEASDAAGKSITFLPTVGSDSIKWTCAGGTVPGKYRPAACKEPDKD